MTVDELMTKVKSEMTGDVQTDIHYINALAEKMKREDNAAELCSALADYAYTILPDKQKKYMYEATFVRDMRMDKAFHEAMTMLENGKLDDAEQLLFEISEVIRVHFEESERKFFSFRNPFEFHLYQHFYPNSKECERAPFDFAHYLTMYGYVLLEKHELVKAAKTVERGIRFNPVCADFRFELAEICKMGGDPNTLLRVNQDTLRVCTTADRIARTLCNMGYFCNMIGDLQSAAVFYFESIRFMPSKAVEFELQDVVRHINSIGEKFNPPTQGQILDTYQKYGLQPPPNDEVVELALTLAKSASEYGRPELEGLFYRVAYDLTNEPKFKEAIDRVDAKLGYQAAENLKNGVQE